MTEFKKKLAGAFRWTSAHPSLSASVSDEGGLLPNRMQTPKVQQRWWDGFRWRDHNPEDFVDEPDFLDRLTAARSARDPEFPARVAAARARLVAESTELSNKMLSARIHELYDENKELKATIVRAQKAAHEPVDGAERIRELEGEQEKALRGLRALPLVREADLTGFPPLVPNDDADRAENPLGG